MAKQLASIDTSEDTFLAWITKTNYIIDFANTEVVTANSSANGAFTTGKGYVIGSFGSNTLMCSTLRGGNTTSNTSIEITSNTLFSGNTVIIQSGASLGSNSFVLENGTRANTSGNTAQAVDSFPSSSWRSAKYIISIKNATSGEYQVTELILTHDGTDTYSTEYATLVSNNVLSLFTTDINSGNVRLIANPNSSPLEMTIAKTLIKN